MQPDNAAYALVQLVHNFGAAGVAGLPVAVLWLRPPPAVVKKMAQLTLAAWLAQAVSGAGFGAVSYLMEGELPQIHHLALAALWLKISCALGAIALLSLSLFKGAGAAPGATWRALSLFGLTALAAAAVLRWFS